MCGNELVIMQKDFLNSLSLVLLPLTVHSNEQKSIAVIFRRVQTERDGTRAETRCGLPAKRTSPFISAGVSVQSSTGFLGVRVGRERL